MSEPLLDDRELLRDVATVVAQLSETNRRLTLLEDEVKSAKTAVYRIVWIILVTLLGQILSKFVGIAAILEALK